MVSHLFLHTSETAGTDFFYAEHGLDVLPITVRVLKQNFTPDVLLGPLAQAPARKAARVNDCLFNSTMTSYITAILHYKQINKI